VEGWLWEAVAFVVRLVGHGLDIDDEEVLRGHSARHHLGLVIGDDAEPPLRGPWKGVWGEGSFATTRR